MGKRRRFFRQTTPPAVLSRGSAPSPARALALKMLVRSRGPHAQAMEAVMDEARGRGEVSPRDAALASELARGVCRNRRWLENVLSRYLHHPLPRQAAKVHESLLVGIYQALFLDRIPPHTIVDETVRMVRISRTEASYRSLANAVMRRIVSEDRARLLPGDEESWLMRHSVPEWLASESGQVFRNGETRAFFEASNRTAPLNLRAVGARDSLRIDEVEGALRGEVIDATHMVPEIARGHYLEDCFVLQVRGLAPDLLPLFRRGLITAEDEGAQIAGWLAGAREGMRVLDLCASPGGKTVHMADIANRRFKQLVACDVTEAKLNRLRETLQRTGLAGLVEVRLAGDLENTPQRENFDLVLVDAPCSGLGTIRRHPEVRWRGSTAEIRALARLQAQILDRAAALVRPGGTLVYSVCTFTMAETDGQIDRFLAAQQGSFSPAPAPGDLPFDEKPLCTAPGRWRTMTHRDGCDTFFVARMQKNTPSL